MIYSSQIKEAMLIAEKVHRGQFDKGGYPYIFHPYAVAEILSRTEAFKYADQSLQEDLICTALLHDVLEAGVLYLNVAAYLFKTDGVARVKRLGGFVDDAENALGSRERRLKFAQNVCKLVDGAGELAGIHYELGDAAERDEEGEPNGALNEERA